MVSIDDVTCDGMAGKESMIFAYESSQKGFCFLKLITFQIQISGITDPYEHRIGKHFQGDQNNT